MLKKLKNFFLFRNLRSLYDYFGMLGIYFFIFGNVNLILGLMC